MTASLRPLAVRIGAHWHVLRRRSGLALPIIALVAGGFFAGWLFGTLSAKAPPTRDVVPIETAESVAARTIEAPRPPAAAPLPDELAALLAEEPEALAVIPPRLARLEPGAEAETVARVAIVLDDMGLLVGATVRAIALDPAISLAFLPYAPDTASLSAEARRAGHQVLLHMPMEPSGDADPGPDALLTRLSAEAIRERLGAALDRVPGAIGLNNHMGSLFTADARAMATVLDEVEARGLMILDSVTTPRSVTADLATALGVPSGSRDVFLDNERDPEAIERQLAEVERIARSTGLAVAIGHPYDETLEVLARWMPRARAAGLEFVPISAAATPPLPDPVLAARPRQGFAAPP